MSKLHSHRRLLIAIAGLLVASPVFAWALVQLEDTVVFRFPPGDQPTHWNGFSSRWSWDQSRIWRPLEHRGRVQLPITLEGPGVLRVRIRYSGRQTCRLRAELDGGFVREITVPPHPRDRMYTVELPQERIRAVVRFRLDPDPVPRDGFCLSGVEWEGTSRRPERRLIFGAATVLAGPFVALLLAGLPVNRAFLAGMIPAGLLALWAKLDGFAAIHLSLNAAPVMGTGIAAVLLARVFTRNLGRNQRPVRLLVFLSVLVHAALMFHPSYYFYDVKLHETLLELVYHRGLVDFWSRFPEYQVAHSLGVTMVHGVARAFPYSPLYHSLTHLGNSILHAPVVWLKLVTSLLAGLTLIPLARLTRRFSSADLAPTFACVLYLFIPCLTRSVLLLENAATLGRLADLGVLTYLAYVALRLDTIPRWLIATGCMTASLGAYTAGYVHIGLLVACLLALSLIIGGLERRQATALATAGLAALLLSFLFYHPDTLRNLFVTVLPDGVAASPSESARGFVDVLGSAGSRLLVFLGAPMLIIGLSGLLTGLRSEMSSSLRLLFWGWTSSAAVAYLLRFFFPDLFLKQKEVYWAGALLAVAGGSMLAERLRLKGDVTAWRSLAIVSVAFTLAALAWLLHFRAWLGQFYGPYMFF